jgi:CheY-like chemotaxis protein
MPLYRSSRGDVGCAEHAPVTNVARWNLERWSRVPPSELEPADAPFCPRCANEPGRTRETPPARKPLVLNVDDQPASLYARERTLRLEGFAVVNAGTAAAAIAAAQRLRPSLILLDVQLPDGDGRDVCRSLKQDEALGSIPVVLISASIRAHAENLDALRWGHADGYVVEPIDPATFVSTLRRVLSSAV